MKRRCLLIGFGILYACLCLCGSAISAGRDPAPAAPAVSESVPAAGLPATPAVLVTMVPPGPCSGPYTTGVAYDSIHKTMWVGVTPSSGPGFVCEFMLTPPYTLMAWVPVINPYDLTFDSTTGYLWVTDTYSAPGTFANTVTVVDTAGAGAIVNILPTGVHPAGDCYFKGDIYVMDFGPPAGPWSFTEYLNKAPWTTATYAAPGNDPHSCVAVGSDLWLTLEFSNTVEKVAPPAAGVTFPVGFQPWGITYDGTSVWVANQNSNTVETLDPATGVARAAAFNVAPGNSPRGLAYGKAAGVRYVWAVDEVSGTLTQIQVKGAPTWGTVTGTSAAFGVAPQFDAFDPINNHIWVTSTTSGTITILN